MSLRISRCEWNNCFDSEIGRVHQIMIGQGTTVSRISSNNMDLNEKSMLQLSL
jgi:hypothetical protein